MGLHTAVGAWPFLPTCLGTTVGIAVVLALWWCVLAAVAVTTFPRRPACTPFLPAIALVIWAAVVASGAAAPPWTT